MSSGDYSNGEARDAFHGLETALQGLDAYGSASLLAATADVAILVSPDGVIRQAALSGDEAREVDHAGWVGRALADVVAADSRSKVGLLLSEAGGGRMREINMATLGGDVPIRLSAVPLARDGMVLAVGRSLRPVAALQRRLIDIQRAMERDNQRLRQIETQYRRLFQLAAEGVLIVDVHTGRVVEGNPAAGQWLGLAPERVVGRLFSDLFDATSREAAARCLVAAQGQARAEPLALSASGRSVAVTATAFRHDGQTHALVRFGSPDGAGTGDEARTADIIARWPDGFVVADGERRILTANVAFLDLAELGSEAETRDRPLERWLGRGSADFQLLTTTLREHGAVRDFATVVRGEFGAVEPVEVSAVAVADAEPALFGFVVRSLKPRPDKNPFSGGQLPRSTDQVVDLVGRMSLKDIVRETADVIERLCIEAALKTTGDNRASASLMLGLSRQSLYAKMRRYGIGDPSADDQE